MYSEILYGIHPVHEALRAGRRAIKTVFVAEGRGNQRVSAITALAHSKKVTVKVMAAAKFAELSGSSQHQGVAARVGRYPLVSLSEIMAGGASSAKAPLVLLLDCLVDPHNLGALLRTAFCAGATGVVLPKHNAAGPTPAVSRISAGALEHVALAQATNLADTIVKLKQDGFWVYGLDGQAETSVFDCDLTGPLALVVGGEAKGVRPLIKKKCDLLVAVYQSTRINSLNASVAGAVVLYEAVRQRLGTRKK